MLPITHIQEEIAKYLHYNLSSALADCLDLVPEDNQRAMYKMIVEGRANRVTRETLAQRVTDDVAACVEGKPENAEHSKEFLGVNE